MGDTLYKVKAIRKKKKLTQEQLAKMAGISRVTLSWIESGKVGIASTKTLSKLAEALNVSVRDLFLP